MKIYLITDCHFGHEKMLEFGRPEGYENLILKNLSRLNPGDLLINLGDFALGGHREEDWIKLYKEATPGVKHVLVAGNHDQHNLGWYMNKGFDFACRTFSGKFFGRNLLFSHIPRDLSHHPYTEFNIHGHFHTGDHRASEPAIQAYYNPEKHIKLAIEETNYKPVLLERLITQSRQKSPTRE